MRERESESERERERGLGGMIILKRPTTCQTAAIII